MKHFFSLWRGWPATLLMLLWLAGPAARAQAPAWTQLGTGLPVSSGAYSYAQADATDAAGNVYLAGYFSGSVRFGTTVLTSNNTSSATLLDGFVAKWSTTTGTFAWALALNGPGTDQATAITVNNGAVYVAGSFANPGITIGSFPLTTTNSSLDVFVACLADAGTTASVVWARQAGGPGLDLATGVAASGGAVFVSGSFTGATFTAGGTVLNNAASGTSDAFVAKLLDTGATTGFANALSFGSSGSDEARALATSGGNVYVVGDFTSPTLLVGGTVLTNAGTGSNDVFVAKLADGLPALAVVWAQRAGGPGADTGDAIAVQGSSVWVAGSFSGPSATVGPYTLANAGGTNATADALVARLDDAGASATVRWALAGGGVGPDRPRAVAVRGAHVYLAGGYGYPSATFGSNTLSNRGTGNTADIFVAKLADAGTGAAFAWAQSAGVAGESAFGLGFIGNLVVAVGGAAPPADFGSLAVPPGSTTAVAFVATLTDPTLTATTAAQATLRFSLAPNPARTATTVQLPAVPGAATATLTLTDALGRLVHTQNVVLTTRSELDLTSLAPGLYAVQVQAGGTRGTQRLVVE